MLRLTVFNDASEMSRVFVVNTGVQKQLSNIIYDNDRFRHTF